MQYRKKSIVVEAEQWMEITYDREGGLNIPPIYHLDVEPYRVKNVTEEDPCQHCQHAMIDHGWVDTLEGGHIVCPGDQIIVGVKGERYPCKDDVFRMSYESYDSCAEIEREAEDISVEECDEVLHRLSEACSEKRDMDACTSYEGWIGCPHHELCSISFAIATLTKWKAKSGFSSH